MLDHREHLFNGDARVASLFLWHFCEEIEHRSSGLMVYDHVYGNYWYRVSRFKGFMKHVGEVINAITEEFQKAFPELPAELFTGNSNFKMPLPGQIEIRLWHHHVADALAQPGASATAEYFDEWSAHL